MPAEPAPPVDYATLADYLTALAYPARLELLDLLRFPHTLGEIRLAPHKEGPGGGAALASRQTVRGHLAKLVETDLVRVDAVERDGRSIPRYVVNPPKLYALVEELRRLSVMRAATGAAGDATGTLGAAADAEDVTGPRLVLVHGVYEGKAFPLDARSAPDGVWVVGRRRDVAVSLEYDPFVSLENATVTREGSGFVVTDHAESKNGTSVNWRLLPRGGSRDLEAGAVIGVGRSLLSFVPR